MPKEEARGDEDYSHLGISTGNTGSDGFPIYLGEGTEARAEAIEHINGVSNDRN